MVATPDVARLERPWVRSYPPGVPPSYDLPAVPVTRLLDDAARDLPEVAALRCEGLELDHAALALLVDALARGLVASGVAPGDHLLVALPAGLSAPLVALAAWRAGAVVVPLDPATDGERLDAVLALVAPSAVLAPRTVLQRVREAPQPQPQPQPPALAVEVPDDGWLLDVGATRAGSWWHRRSRGPRRARRPRRGGSDVVWLPALVAPDARVRRMDGGVDGSVEGEEPAPELDVSGGADASDIAADAGTSGVDAAEVALPPPPAVDAVALVHLTAGPEPVRGVELTHASLVAATFAARLWVPDVQAGGERLLVVEGLHDLPTLVLGWLTGLLAASTVVLVPDADGEALARAVAHEAPTVLVASTARLRALADAGGAHDLASLRVVLATGGRLPPPLATDLEQRTGGARVRTVAGLPETGGISHAQPVYGRVVPGALGIPVTGTLAAVVDPVRLDVPVAPGEVGLLLVRGPQVARSYLGEAARSAATFVDGWLVSDLLVAMDEAGAFTCVGRRAEVVVRDGVHVGPDLVESALERHPAVQRAGAVSDAAAGTLRAAVTLRRRQRPTPDELRAHCARELGVGDALDHLAVVGRIPETPDGTTDRVALAHRLDHPSSRSGRRARQAEDDAASKEAAT